MMHHKRGKVEAYEGGGGYHALDSRHPLRLTHATLCA